MPAEPVLVPDPPSPPNVAPLELERLRGAVRAGLFGGPAAPPQVGRYELLRCIGQGGMGIVYAARDVELGREVAIKLLRPELSHRDDERLTSEARALARLSHPNVVSVYDVGTYQGQRFIAMEFVPGDNLRRWLDAPRTLRQVLEVFQAAGQGLFAAHSQGLVHRDFKPDNVLVGNDGRPRVLDFGLARPPDASGAGPLMPPQIPAGVDPLATMLTEAGQVLGTPAYMAPEQHMGEPADARSDQFSFAVALYQAVYGARPFPGDDPRSLALSIVRGRLRPGTPRYPVPPWLDDMLVRALSVDPAGRFSGMDRLLERMSSQLQQETGGQLDVLPVRGVQDDRASMPELSQLSSLGLADTEMAWRNANGSASAAGSVAGAMVVADESAMARAKPPGDDLGDQTTSVSTRRRLPHPVDPSALEIMVRELDRLAGRRGKVQRLGASLTWTTKTLEVHVDVDARGTELLVWRRLGRAMRRRTVLWTGLGTWLGSLMIAVFGNSGLFDTDLFEALIPLMVFGPLLGGGWMGYRKAQSRHRRALPAARAEIDFIADRISGLAGQAPLMLSPGGA